MSSTFYIYRGIDAGVKSDSFPLIEKYIFNFVKYN